MKPFNQLSPAEAELLALLSEECGEVIQAIGKILRHGYESCHPVTGVSNRSQLEIELGDVLHAFDKMADAGDISDDLVHTRAIEKRVKVETFLHHQPKRGER